MTTHPDHTDSPTAPGQSPTAAPPKLGELRLVDPATLVIGLNTRREVVLDPHFCADVADRGVREPITVRVDQDGRLVVRKGQRRTLAACRAGLPAVRVLVEAEPHTGTDDTDAQIARIVDQHAENFHRRPITDADAAEAHQQLLDLGLTAGQIARRTHTPVKRVRAIHTVTTSPVARAALSGVGGPPLRLDHAVVVAEFDDDSADSAQAVELLLETAENDPDRFGHIAQRLRDDREESRMVAEQAQVLTSEGVRVLTDDEAGEATRLHRLRPAADSAPGTDIDPREHTSCPGHAVHLSCVRVGWSSNDKQVKQIPYCTEAGRHAPRFTSNPGTEPAPELSDEQAQKDHKLAERRRVIANNKAWDSATTERRRWLAEFIARKKPPTDAAAFIARTLATGSHDIRKAMESGSPTACALLGLPEPPGHYCSGPRPLVEAARTATGARATQLSLAVLLGAFEDGTSRESWRSPTRETVAYFATLRTWRYPLSDVETLVLDPDDDQTDDTDDESAAEQKADQETDQETEEAGEDDDPDAEAGDGRGCGEVG